jgi:ribonuclease P protein component
VSKQFTFGRNERLKSRKAIEQLFKQGKSFSVFPFRVYYLSGQFNATLQFGTGVSSKNFKKAVDRNRVKRLSRETWRLQKPVLQDALKEQNVQLNVFLIYTAKELPVYQEIYEKTGRIIQKLCQAIRR